MLIFVCLLGLFAQSSSQVTETGSCSGSPTSFIEETLGVWYKYARTPNVFDDGFVCTNVTLFKNFRGGVTLHVDSIIRISGARIIWEEYLVKHPTDGSYIMKYPRYASLPGARNRFLVSKSKQWMLWQECVDGTDKQPVWILSETRDLGRRDLEKIDKALRSWNLRGSMFEKIDTTNCPHFDEIIGLPK